MIISTQKVTLQVPVPQELVLVGVLPVEPVPQAIVLEVALQEAQASLEAPAVALEDLVAMADQALERAILHHQVVVPSVRVGRV